MVHLLDMAQDEVSRRWVASYPWMLADVLLIKPIDWVHRAGALSDIIVISGINKGNIKHTIFSRILNSSMGRFLKPFSQIERGEERRVWKRQIMEVDLQ